MDGTQPHIPGTESVGLLVAGSSRPVIVESTGGCVGSCVSSGSRVSGCQLLEMLSG